MDRREANRTVMDALYESDPNVVYHGTTPENAESIAQHGFDNSKIGSHHRAETEGHYFAATPEQALEYGPSVVSAELNAEIHPAPFHDGYVTDHYYKGESLRDSVDKAGWGGFEDEDGAIVVLNGRNAHFRRGVHTSRNGETF